MSQTLTNQANQSISQQNRPGSVTGSIEGRLASGNRGRREFMASSPVQEVPEEDMDLWDQASLDYPGRYSPGQDGFEEFDDFIEDGRDDIIFYDEPRYHTWHVILLAFTWLLAAGIGKNLILKIQKRVIFSVKSIAKRNCPLINKLQFDDFFVKSITADAPR